LAYARVVQPFGVALNGRVFRTAFVTRPTLVGCGAKGENVSAVRLQTA
jgi:hypothetical protein